MPIDEKGNYYISQDNKSEQLVKRGLGVQQTSPLPRFKDIKRTTSEQMQSSAGQYFGNEKEKYIRRLPSLQGMLDSGEDVGEQIQQNLGEVQTAGEKIGNAILGNAVIAGTTFANTFATLISALFSPAINTREGLGDNIANIYNNPMSKGLRNLQNSAEEALPIYGDRTEPVKFIADFIKNLGFTEGTILSDTVLAAIPYAGPMLATILGPMGEAAFEAGNLRDDKVASDINLLRDNYNKQLENINKITDVQQRNQAIQELNKKYAEDYATIQQDADRAGNIVFGSNVALLTLTNALEFGNIINAAARRAEKAAIKSAINKAEKELIGSGIEGTAKQQVLRAVKREAAEEAARRSGIEVSKKGVLEYAAGKEYGKAIATWLGKSASEAFEEGSQDWIQKIPYYYGGEDGVNRYAESVNDPEAREYVSSFMDASIKAFSDIAHDPNTYLDMATGFLTGAIGTPGLRSFRSETGGFQLPLTWNGGAAELAGNIKNVAQKNRIVKQVNEQLFADNKFNTLYNGLVQQIAAQGTIEEGTLEGDVKKYQDAQSAKLYTHIRMLDKIGMADHITETAKSIASMNDEQLTSFLDSLDDNNPLKKKSLEKVRESFKDAAETISNAVSSIKSDKAMLELAYGNKMSDEIEDNLLYLRHQQRNAESRKYEIVESLYDIYKRRATSLNMEVLNEGDFYNVVTTQGKGKDGNLAKQDTYKMIKDLVTDGMDVGTEEEPGTLKEDNEKLIEDLPKVIKSSEAYANEFKRITSDFATARKEEDDRTAKAVTENQNRLDNKEINGLSDVQSAVDYYNKNRGNASIKDLIDKSSNPYIKKAKAITERADQILTSLPEDITEQERADVQALINNFINNATVSSTFNTNDAAFTNSGVLPESDDDTLESRDARFERAITIIQTTMDNIDRHSAGDSEIPSEDPNNISFTSTGVVLGEESGNNSNTPEVPVASGGTDNTNAVAGVVITDVKTSVAVDGKQVPVQATAFTSTTGSSNTGDKESNVETASTSEPITATPVENGIIIQPAVGRYRKESMTADANGQNTFDEQIHPESKRIVEFLSNQTQIVNGREVTFNAFEFTDSGKLQEYKNNGGALYFGVNSDLVNDKGEYIVLQLINIDGQYLAIGTNYNTVTGDAEFNTRIRDEFSDVKYKDGKIHKSSLAEAKIIEVMSGRNAFQNNSVWFHQALDNTRTAGVTTLHVVVNTTSELVGMPKGTRVPKDRLSKTGSTYIATPNAKGGYNLVALQQVPISNAKTLRQQLADNPNNRYLTELIKAAEGIAEAMMRGDSNEDIGQSIANLNKYLAIKKIDFLRTKESEPRIIIRELEFTEQGAFKLDDNGNRKAKPGSRVVSEGLSGYTVEGLADFLLNALASKGCVSWVGKEFAQSNDIKFLEDMSKAGYLKTHALDFVTRASWYKAVTVPVGYNEGGEIKKTDVTPPSQLNKPTTETKSPISQSKVNKLFANMGRDSAKSNTSGEQSKSNDNQEITKNISEKLSRRKNTEKLYKVKRREVINNLKRILPQLASEDVIIIADNLISSKTGEQINGSIALRDAIIKINSVAPLGTEYHEAFHYVFNVLCNEEQRRSILSEAKQEYGKQYSDEELEEFLADAFRDYMNIRQNVFERAWQSIKKFFNKLLHLTQSEEAIKNNTDALFKAIEEGKFASNELRTIDAEIKESAMDVEVYNRILKDEAEESYLEYEKTLRALREKRFDSYSDCIKLIKAFNKKYDNWLSSVKLGDKYAIKMKKGTPEFKPEYVNWYINKYGATQEELNEVYGTEENTQSEFVTNEEIEMLREMGISDDMLETISKDTAEWLIEHNHSVEWINNSTKEERDYAKSCS